MKATIQLICIFCFLGVSSFSSGADFTGFWKRNCTDNFGIQIKPIDNQLYSVCFCGPGGCFAPGEWTPNTRIAGDQNYQIDSPDEIGIKRKDKNDFFIYKKCTSDPTWAVAESKTEEIKLPDCAFDTKAQEQGVLIAWVTDVRATTQFGHGIKKQTIVVGPFRPLALLSGSTLTETPGSSIYKGQPFWYALSPDEEIIKLSTVDSFFDLMNEGQCVYFGSLEKPKTERWALLSSKPLRGVFRSPTSKESTEFYRLNTTCVQQGDYPAGQEPPCVRPRLIAVSDFNKNDEPEYWVTEPYLWDTGLTVWENKNGSRVPLLQVCVGCSD